MTKFIFDLDGTITKQETLPLVSSHFGILEQIDKLTQETIQGNIPFVESFIRRVHILKEFPVDEISNLLESVELHEKVAEFIKNHRDDCIIATGNLKCWIDKLATRVGGICYSSDGKVINNKVEKLTYILKKETIVREYKSQGEKVVFIGEGNNDVEAMREADISIASGLTHNPSQSVLAVADYLIFDEEVLCRQLNQLL